jgi:hypothetical protein
MMTVEMRFDGKWYVIVGSEPIGGPFCTSAEAWRSIDRALGEVAAAEPQTTYTSESIKQLVAETGLLRAENKRLGYVGDAYESLCASHKRLEATNKRLREALDECRDWFAKRHDGETDGVDFFPNEEMKMTAMIDHALEATR